MGPKGADGPCNSMGHMGLMGHMRQFLSAVATTPSTAHCPLPTAHCPLPTAHCRLPTAHCPLPPAISACKARSTSPGCNPGSPPNAGVRPVRAALRCGPGNAPSTPTWRHATKSCQGASKVVGVHPGKREPAAKSTRPRKARCCTPGSHPTRRVLLRAALTGRKLPEGGLTWHFMPG